MNKKVLGLIIILVVAGAAAFIYNKFSGSGYTIKDFDSEFIPIGEDGNYLFAKFDKDNNLEIPKIKDKALEKLGITREEYAMITDPFAITKDEKGNPVIPGLEDKILQKNKKNGEVAENPGEGEKNPIQDDNEKQSDQGSDGNNKEEDNMGTETSNSQNDNDDIKLDEEDLKDIENTDDSNNVFSEIVFVEEEDKSVLKLPMKFYEKDVNWSSIPETNYRDLMVKPSSEAANPFVYYNWKGVLKPFRKEGYVNRQLFGMFLNFNFFKKSLGYNSKVTEENFGNGVNIVKDNALKEIKKNILILQKLGFYKELENIPVNSVTYKIYDIIEKSLNSVNSSELGAEADTSFAEEYVKTLNKLSLKSMTSDLSAKLFFNCYEKELMKHYNKIKEGACEELNTYKGGTCASPDEISSLEICSDFIQQSYIEGLINGYKVYLATMIRINQAIEEEG